MNEFKYCKKCLMPNTRPGISFNEEGVCSACVNYENRKNIDYYYPDKVLIPKLIGNTGKNM